MSENLLDGIRKKFVGRSFHISTKISACLFDLFVRWSLSIIQLHAELLLCARGTNIFWNRKAGLCARH